MKYIKALICTIALIIFDQWTKYTVLMHIKPISSIPLIPEVLSFTYHENRGAVWGIMQGQIPILIVSTVIILSAVIYIFFKIPDTKKYIWLRIVAVLITSGAIGNFIDRVFRQYVVDFIYFELINFPIFNVADIYVTCAAIVLMVLGVFYYKDEDIELIFPSKKNKDKE